MRDKNELRMKQDHELKLPCNLDRKGVKLTKKDFKCGSSLFYINVLYTVLLPVLSIELIILGL